MKNYGGSGMDLAQYGGAAAAAPVMDMMAPETGPGYKPDNERFDYTYDPGRASQEDLDAQRAAYAARGITGGELKYFNPTYAGPNKTYVAKGGLLSLAEGGMPSDYEYDPVSQTYKKVVQAPTGAVAPVGIDGSGRTGDSSSDNQPMSQQTIDFLDGLAAGGMSKGGFVVPADVVSALGNGSTDAGLRKLQSKLGKIKPIKGAGDGLSDSIPTSIDGKQPARVADGEAYIDPSTVAKIGSGDMKKGAKKLYAMMDKIRQQAHGKKTQQREVNAKAVV
jgi:hypothetical protein